MEHFDHRDVAGLRGDWYKSLNDRAMTAIVELDGEDDEGSFSEDVTVRVEWGVCSTCDGSGSHVNPSIDAHGLTAEDFDADPDFAEDYLRGKYDIQCNECHGQRVVPVVANDDPNRDRVFERMAIIAMAAAEQAREMRWGF